MALKFSEVRSAIAAQISNIAGYTEAKFPPAFFGRQENTLAHKSYAVGVLTTEDAGERQRNAIYYLQTIYEVKIAYRLRPLDVYPTDYDNALDSEEEVIKAVLSSYTSINNKIQTRFLRCSRDIPDSLEYMITTLEFITYQTI
jgi:hypothetical protein